jgi:hypothetical protein
LYTRSSDNSNVEVTVEGFCFLSRLGFLCGVVIFIVGDSGDSPAASAKAFDCCSICPPSVYTPFAKTKGAVNTFSSASVLIFYSLIIHARIETFSLDTISSPSFVKKSPILNDN